MRDKLDRFFDVEGPNRVVFYHEPVVVKEENGEWVRKSSTPEIRLAEGEFGTLKVSNKVVFFVRITTKGVSDKTMDTDVAFGEVLPNALESFRSLLGEIFVPMLREQAAWGKNSSEDTQDFLQSAVKFSSTLNEAVHSLQGGIELAVRIRTKKIMLMMCLHWSFLVIFGLTILYIITSLSTIHDWILIVH